MDGQPVLVLYVSKDYFDLEFIDIYNESSGNCFTDIPLDWDFSNIEIRELTPLEKLLW